MIRDSEINAIQLHQHICNWSQKERSKKKGQKKKYLKKNVQFDEKYSSIHPKTKKKKKKIAYKVILS